MLLGAFPFEHTTASASDEQRAFNEVHFEQIRIHWTENERNKEIVKRMSEECKDLLDRIFTLDEKKRIKIDAIKQHPWYTEPLSAKYAAAMDKLRKDQADLTRRMELARVRCCCLQRCFGATCCCLRLLARPPGNSANIMTIGRSAYVVVAARMRLSGWRSSLLQL